ncbi:histidine kinase [Amycolatopsis sp. WAC 01375]|uniref:sensor histidine kinase n=1 Tax=unclassified Amycolatopsis TaxID=2618356 RepID=UPI000F7B0E9C|nr:MULTISPECIES: histidine kinase [unclassified Amycolatopsis]RSM76918.1 histidine kinase [Amycolatopsis sp. WAC 01375]RSN26019.1 histidine kinase [Amycolatopsis sp. WAC 01416]
MLEILRDRFRARVQASLTRAGLSLPWWVPATSTLLSVVFAVVAVVQRDALVPPQPVALGGLLVLATPLAWAVTGWVVPWARVAALIAAAAVLLIEPALPDFAPLLLLVAATEAGSVLRTTWGIALVTVAGEAVLVVAGIWGGLIGGPVYMVAILLGLSGGLMVRWYTRVLDAERDNRDASRDKALLAERQRIAREVHDVVGHSLSITLLHLTGARHALQQDRDVDEAIEALTEAEQVGRAAMADIRRTVGLLADSPSGSAPLPGVEDIATLVERTRSAGLAVRYTQEGDLGRVGASEGLGLYRIVQESLVNVVKHAPGATAEVRLNAGRSGVKLIVSNTLPSPVRRSVEDGSGLAGMAVRAAQLGADLSAGPSGRQWIVQVTVPGAKA